MNSSNQNNKSEEDFAKLLEKIALGIPQVEERDTSPDTKDILEVVDLEFERRKVDLNNEILLLDLRETYGKNIIQFLWIYFVFSSTILIGHGFHLFGFVMPDLVLVALVGGTAVSVLGVVGTVAAGLFRAHR